MRWQLVIPLALAGVAFGVLTVAAWIHGYEGTIALLLLTSIGGIVALLEQHRPVRNGFGAGFFASISAVAMQVLFFDTYMTNNPDYLNTDIPFGLSPIVYTLSFAPIGGLIGGLLAALTAWLVARVRKATG